MSQQNDKTRRGILKAGLVAVGGAAAAGAAHAAGAGVQHFAQDKIAPAAVQYVDKTKNPAQRCDNCVNWEAPAGCKIVSGKIAPEGWCIAWAPKSG
ncbi:MAG: hypothetical protein U1E70_22285 [Acetobacteraceae bacterium]|nr:iron oxidase [Pseudomonadota bacterium]